MVEDNTNIDPDVLKEATEEDLPGAANAKRNTL